MALTAAAVDEIRRLHQTGQLGADELAERYGVSRATVYRSLKTE
nr:helix-turn-helix domain-containing protein [Micromonospora sp. DSM 115978]